MNQTTEAKNYICVNCKLVTNHKQKRCIQCGCQTHEPTAADVTYPADTRHEVMTTEAKDKTDNAHPSDNELIAEFMDVRVSKGIGDMLWTCDEEGFIDYSSGDEVYSPRNSWGQLMPIVEKISKITFNWESEFESGTDSHYLRTFGMLDEETGRVMVRINNCGLHFGQTLIEATYNAVVEFIKLNNASHDERI